MQRLSRFYALMATTGLLVGASAADVALIPFGSTWKYLDNGSNQGTAWRTNAFNDAGWNSGPAELGYGDGDEATVLSYGPNASSKYLTTYFRKSIAVPSVNAYAGFSMRIKRDDGVVVYLNGTEVLRQNIGQGSIAYNTLAYQAVATSEEFQLLQLILTPSQFINGNNTIAVEIHQNAVNSSDISFDLELIGLDAQASLHRGPYLHVATPTGVTVVWATDVPTDSRVRFGPAPSDLSTQVDVAPSNLHHEVAITGLKPATRYYYAIGSSTQDLTIGDTLTFFDTHPVPGEEAPQRIWVVGDAGTGFASQASVRNSFINFIAGSAKADAWLMLGDNAYAHGRESEYQLGIFHDMYEDILRNTPLWPAPGNHDYGSGANGNGNTGPYYDLFALPKQAQAGGVPSNTEAYYSFDLGNIHLIALDSYGVSRAVNGAMANWLLADLAYAEVNSKWIIAYWHHPPYTKGSHNSDDAADSGGLMRDMRENILPILEAHGVDLVLSGHSHSYERSFLIDGHYGLSPSFNSGTMGLDMTSGRANGTGAYTKPAVPSAHSGTVYTVCGVSGKKDATGTLDHPAMYLSTYDHYGSMVLDVQGDQLHALFLNDAGTVVDQFDLTKPASTVKLVIKVLLQGPYATDTGLMRDDLRTAGLIPLLQPFNGLFPLFGGGGESIEPSVLLTNGSAAIVDWILVELRSRTDPSNVVATRAALVRRDGLVVDVDGTSPVAFGVPVGPYHVAVRHRNHLGVMTATPTLINRATPLLDLTSPATPTWGTNAQYNNNGTQLLWGGDVLRDGAVIYTGTDNDRDPILSAIGGVVPTQTVTGYRTTDVDLNGVTLYTGEANDRDRLLFTIGGTVPTNIRFEQIP